MYKGFLLVSYLRQHYLDQVLGYNLSAATLAGTP